MGPFLTERRKDQLATVLIRTGGLLVILVVVGIVINIGSEAVPLFRRAAQGPVEIVAEGGDPLLAGSDPRRDVVWVLERDGTIRFPGTRAFEDLEISEESTRELAAADQEIHGLVSAITRAGTVVVGGLRFPDTWEGDVRQTTARWHAAADPLQLGEGDWAGVTVNSDEDGNLLAAAWMAQGELSLASWDAEDESWAIVSPPSSHSGIRTVAVAEGLQALAVVEGDGSLRVFRWPSLDQVSVVGIDSTIDDARFLIGGGTLVAAAADGSVNVLLEVPAAQGREHGRKAAEAGGRDDRSR